MRKFLPLLAAILISHFSWSNTTINALVDSVLIDIESDSLLVCTGTSIELSTTAPADSVSWTPADDFDDPSASTVILTPSQSQWYFMTAFVNGEVCEDSVFVDVIDPTFEASLSIAMDSVICPEESVEVTFNASHPITSVSWDPEDEVVDPTDIEGTTVRPLRTTEYIVTATIGNCEVSDTFTIRTVMFELETLTPDTIFLCKPDTVVIRMNIIPPGETITWSPLDGSIEPNANGRNASVFPEVSTTYTATAMSGECTLSRDIYVRVDSLPDLEPLTALPFKDPYCAGDTFWILGPRVDTALYPDLMFRWIPMDGQIVGPDTPGTTGNVRVSIRDTTTFFREVTNNACFDSSQITVNAIPPEIPLSLNDTSACPGEEFQVFVLDPAVMGLEWTPEQGLSCTDCPDPTVTVQTSPITYMLTGNKEDCPVTAQLTVNPLPFFTIPVDPPQAFGCEGDMIQLNIDTFLLTGLSVTISSGNGALSCSDCSNPVVTIGSESGTILVSGTVPDSLGCGAQAIIPYGVGPQENDVITEVICPDQPTVFDLSIYGFENPQIEDPEGIANCDGLNCTVTVGNAGGSLFVNSDDASPGFCGKRTEIRFQPLASPGAMILPPDSMQFGQGESAELTLEPSGPDGATYMWFVNGVEQQDQGNPGLVTFPTNTEVAEVKVVWTNELGCMQMATTSYRLQPPGIKFPNAFTPNGDDDNERFRPMVTGPAVLDELLVFNRWGQVVFDGNDPNGWDGTFDGEPAPAEVYVYLATFTFPNGDKTNYKGDVTLIR